ncbi:FkbM family methyltransferase [bacterium]|nr:FkbM family methyltransferase [bacterium]
MQTKLAKYTINFLNEQEYHLLKNEIFTNDCYYFETDKEQPLIIDVGAYIGLSVLYFKREYPNAKIIAFEPNPVAIPVLNENIFNNNLDNIKVHESAIWVEDGIKKMYIDNTKEDRYSVSSFTRNSWNGTVKSKLISVKTERLDKYVNREVDLLKLDIEGAEQRVLKSIKRYFPNIKNIIFEYHPTQNQNLKKIIELLETHYDLSIYRDAKEIKQNFPANKLLLIKATYKK